MLNFNILKRKYHLHFKECIQNLHKSIQITQIPTESNQIVYFSKNQMMSLLGLISVHNLQMTMREVINIPFKIHGLFR